MHTPIIAVRTNMNKNEKNYIKELRVRLIDFAIVIFNLFHKRHFVAPSNQVKIHRRVFVSQNGMKYTNELKKTDTVAKIFDDGTKNASIRFFCFVSLAFN